MNIVNHSDTECLVNRSVIPNENQHQLKINKLRTKRKEFQNQLQIITNRTNFKRKKNQEQLHKYLKTADQMRAISETRNFNKFNELLKEQIDQKRQFESKKKAIQVENERTTNLRRMSLIYQSVKSRKFSESSKIRLLKKNDHQIIEQSKRQVLMQRKQKKQLALKQRQKQQLRRKYYWLWKKMHLEQQFASENGIYEHQLNDYYQRIAKLRDKERELRIQEELGAKTLRSVEQSYAILRRC